MERSLLDRLSTNMQGRRVISRRLVIAFVIATAACLGLPQSSFAKSGTLDRSFGVKGKAVIALDFEGKRKYFYGHHVYADLDPNGRIVVLSSGFRRNFVVRFLPNGKRDRAFGNGGVLKIDPQVDVGQFEAKDLEVDELGRVLVAASFATGDGSSAIVIRFDWRGQPDPSFGEGDGVLVVAATDFNLLPPPPSGPAYSPFTPVPSTVGISSLLVDPSGRILFAGTAGRREGYCAEVTGGFVARLTDAGQLDESFGTHGVSKPIPYGGSSIAIDAADRHGGLLAVGGVTGCRGSGEQGPVLFRLNDVGSLDTTFGDGGFAYKSFGSSGVIAGMETAQDRSGNIVALESLHSSVSRLSSSGTLDRRFADQGRLHLGHPPSTNWTDLDVAGDGSIVIVGTKKRGTGTPGGQVALTRLSSRGGPYPGFGRHGVVTVGRKRTTNLTGRQVLLDGRGHVIVAGSVRDRSLSTGEGLALFRFDLKIQNDEEQR